MSKFCKDCGSLLKEGVKFCPNCGSHIKDITSDVTPIKNVEVKNHKVIKNNNAKKTSKPLLIISLVLCIVISLTLFASIGYIRSNRTPEKLISKFQSAIISKDYSKLKGLLYSSDESIAINEESLKPMVEAFTSTPEELTKVVDQLNKDKLLLNYSQPNSEEGTFTLKSKGKSLLGEKYYIQVTPIKIIGNFSNSNIKLYKNEELLYTSTKDEETQELIKLLPGQYVFNANITNEFTDISEEYSLSLFDSTDGDLDILPEAYTVKVSSSIPEAIIIIDGVNTGVAVEDIVKIGPFNREVVVQAIHDVNGNVKKSKEFKISGSKKISFDFSNYTSKEETSVNSLTGIYDAESQVKDTMKNYLRNFADAVNLGDFTIIEPYLFNNSELYNTQKKFVTTTHSQGIKEEFIDCTFLDLKFTNEYKTTGTILVSEVYNIIDGTNTKESICEWTYTFTFNPEMGIYQLSKLK